MKRMYCLIFFVSLFLVKNNDCVSIYKKIQWLNLSSLAWEDEEWPNESFNDYLHRCLNYQEYPQPIKKRKIVFSLFDSLSLQSAPHNCLHDIDTMQDLNLFAGKKADETYVAEIVDRTRTEFGKVFLYGLISSPIHDIKALQARQKIIKLFIDDVRLYQQMDELYQQFARSENMVLSLWARDGFLQSTKRRYFSLPYFQNLTKSLNTSVVALELKSLWDHHQRATFMMSDIIAAILLPAYGLCNSTDISLPTTVERVAKRLQGAGGKLFALMSAISHNKYFTSGLFFAAGTSCALAIKEDYEWARDNITLDKCLQKKMMYIAQFFKNIISLSHIISKHPILVELCPAAKDIQLFMQTEFLTPDMQRLFSFFTSSTLSGHVSPFSVQGRVLAAFKLVYDLKEKLEPLLLAIGEIDAYMSCARLYKEYKEKRVQFCFTQYKVDNQPSIIMTDFFNPLIDSGNVVTNSLYLQGPDQRNMVITGPNAGGKSTLIKAVPINLILSQTIGLAAASYAEITPFYSIATYLNVVDDIVAGNSLFKAQVLRAQEMIQVVENTPETFFSFVALDEMFNGTSAKESAAAAYSVVKYIGNYSNNIMIVATHFHLLTTLADVYKAFDNYKVSVDVSEKGIFYPFTLERGVSTQHIALDILEQEGYDYSIIAGAQEVLETLM